MAPAAVLDLIETELGEEALEASLVRDHWLRGDLSYLVRPGAQAVAYEFIERWEREHPGDPGPIVLHMHRGARKTVLLEIRAIERCLRYPGHIERIGFPTMKNAFAATSEGLPKLLPQAPEDLRPKTVEGEVHFRNPAWEDPDAVSKLILFGCREGAEGQRNLRSNGISLDEFREIDRPQYVVQHVLAGHFVHKERPLMVISSTSPATPGHFFWTLVDAAREAGRYLLVPTTDNPDFDEHSERVLVAICGGKDTPAWRREALCEKVADETLLAVPSFYRKKAELVREWERPGYFYPFLFADLGFVDPAAVLFSYIDYERKRLVIEDEIVGSSIGSAELRALIRARERELYEKTPLYHLIRRWADATPRELDDLRAGGSEEGVLFSSAKTGEEKWDKWTGLARLESLCAQERLAIHPRCKNLIYQLENAIKNKWHTDLERVQFEEGQDPTSPIMGHADALWALAYGAWQVRSYWDLSPYPVHGVTLRSGQPLQVEGAGPPPVRVTHKPITITHETRHIRGAVTK